MPATISPSAIVSVISQYAQPGGIAQEDLGNFVRDLLAAMSGTASATGPTTTGAARQHEEGMAAAHEAIEDMSELRPEQKAEMHAFFDMLRTGKSPDSEHSLTVKDILAKATAFVRSPTGVKVLNLVPDKLDLMLQVHPWTNIAYSLAKGIAGHFATKTVSTGEEAAADAQPSKNTTIGDALKAFSENGFAGLGKVLVNLKADGEGMAQVVGILERMGILERPLHEMRLAASVSHGLADFAVRVLEGQSEELGQMAKSVFGIFGTAWAWLTGRVSALKSTQDTFVADATSAAKT